ncbi:MAG: hypothetical protein ABFD92_20935 [Planctomycetaceae bacterium]|mgnify:CR=1 FL=1
MNNKETGNPYRNQEGVKQLTLYLSPESQGDLDEIKGYYGIKNNTEAMRFLIRQEARRLRPLVAESK